MIPKFKPVILSTVPDKDKSIFDSPFLEKNQKLGKRWRRTSFLISQLFIVVPILILVAYLSLTDSSNQTQPGSAIIYLMSIWLPILLMLLSFIPIVMTQFFATAGRLRDIGADPNLALMFFVPILGQLQIIYLLFASPDVGPNKYGPDPRGIKCQIDKLDTCDQTLHDQEQQKRVDLSINENDRKS